MKEIMKILVIFRNEFRENKAFSDDFLKSTPLIKDNLQNSTKKVMPQNKIKVNHFSLIVM